MKNKPKFQVKQAAPKPPTTGQQGKAPSIMIAVPSMEMVFSVIL